MFYMRPLHPYRIAEWSLTHGGLGFQKQSGKNIREGGSFRSSLAQLQRDVPMLASCPSTPCWHGVGVIAPRRLLCSAKQPPYRTRWTRGSGTGATSFSNSSRGESVTPVVPSDHSFVNVYTRSPLAAPSRRSSATAPLAVYRIKRSNWSRRCAGTWVLACSENLWTLTQRGPVSSGRPKPEPIRRTCCPARSPKAIRCLTEAAREWVRAGSSSLSGSYPLA